MFNSLSILHHLSPLPLLLCVALGLACATPPLDARPAGGLAPTSACFEWVVGELTAKEMEGRGAGTAGLERAAGLIEREFGALGLEPPGGSHRQPFEVGTHPVESRLSLAGIPTKLGSEHVPLAFSASGEFTGRLVFVGYGIRAPGLGYDDYAGLDLRGKIALAMRYGPGVADEANPDGGALFGRWSDLQYKAELAHEAGARALILIAPPGDADRDSLPLLRARGALAQADLPVVLLKTDLLTHVLLRQGFDLAAARRAIDRELEPQSRELPALEISGAIQLGTANVQAANLIGVLPGRGELAEEVVVAGAHYDHVGRVGALSHTPDVTALHPGADDNASGVAALLCGLSGGLRPLIADTRPRRTLVVVAFAAGELRQGGSAHYVRAPVLPLEKTVAMLNLHMLGRLRDAGLQTPGSDSAPQWVPLLARAAEGAGIELAETAGGVRPSDDFPFFARGIAALRLTTGTHAEYHAPGDDLATLDLEGGARIAVMLQELVGELLTTAEPPAFAPSPAAAERLGDVRSTGAYLGTIPDLTKISARTGGVALAAVGSESPAERAGVRAGDRVIGMAGIPIPNLGVMTVVLRDTRPGETISILVRRGSERLRFWATLEPKRVYSP